MSGRCARRPDRGDPVRRAARELDRRAGGELSTLATIGELKGERFSAALAAAGDLPARRLVAVGAGPR
jgi:hypothetical protein